MLPDMINIKYLINCIIKLIVGLYPNISIVRAKAQLQTINARRSLAQEQDAPTPKQLNRFLLRNPFSYYTKREKRML